MTDTGVVIGPAVRRVPAFLRRPVATVRSLAPAVPLVLRAIPNPPADDAVFAVERDRWVEPLGDRRPAAVIVVYDGHKASMARMESKASGLLGAVALVSAGIVALLTTAGGALRVAAVVALAYAVSSAYGCCATLFPRKGVAMAPDEALSVTDGYAEMLACAALTEPFVARSAFVLRAAVHDLACAAAITTAAVPAASV